MVRNFRFSSRAVPGGGSADLRLGNGLLYAVAENQLSKSGTGKASHVRLRNKAGDNSGMQPGAFSQFQADFIRRNEILAEHLAEMAVAELRQSIVRPGASTGDLERALLSPRNRWARSYGFGVGNIEYLDSSDAKYWRTIEQGTRYFVGRRMTGIWSASQGGGGPFYPFGRGRNQDTFVPMRAKDALAYLTANGERGPRNGVGRVSGIIKRPITPHHYLRNAWSNFRPREQSKQALVQALRESGVLPS